MAKRNLIIYWVATIWLSLGMVTAGIFQVLRHSMEVELFTHLGYPLYLIMFLGVLKLLGVVVLLIPKYPLVKEWAYAGFFFTMLGALYSHIAAGDPLSGYAPIFLLLALICTSWYFRPADRRL